MACKWGHAKRNRQMVSFYLCYWVKWCDMKEWCKCFLDCNSSENNISNVWAVTGVWALTVNGWYRSMKKLQVWWSCSLVLLWAYLNSSSLFTSAFWTLIWLAEIRGGEPALCNPVILLPLVSFCLWTLNSTGQGAGLLGCLFSLKQRSTNVYWRHRGISVELVIGQMATLQEQILHLISPLHPHCSWLGA